MDSRKLKQEISDKILARSSSTSLYRKTYNEFNKTIDLFNIRTDNFLLSKQQFKEVVNNLNIIVDDKVVEELYYELEPNKDKINYNKLVTKILD
tara:strand:- start:1473 stop:1754 length:282 start_codon:yes stop_codon:yes gene_type:complete